MHRRTVGYDRWSLLVDGRRLFVQSSEFHYFRLPSPDLWRDVLEKLRAGGFNTVSLYFNWAFHSPGPGRYDFRGIRNVDRLLRTVGELGLYAIARPGPYINAETSGGGLPAWLKGVPGRARSSAPGYTAAYRDWLGHLHPILARHQVTRGGPVLLYNVENEYAVNTDAQYMADLQTTARAAGIEVPITTNACSDSGGWAATWSSGPGAVQIPGVDTYPVPFGEDGHGGAVLTERLSPEAPVFAAEYQAGAVDLRDTGYERCRERTGPPFMRDAYRSNLIGSGATVLNYYLGFGGTNWGWLAQPNDVYTSYDYGAAITEARQLTDKYDEFKRQGLFLQSLPPTRTEPIPAPTPSVPTLQTAARADPGTHTQYVLLRRGDDAPEGITTGSLDWATPDGRYDVPVAVAGRDTQILVAGCWLGGQRLVYSSSQLLAATVTGGQDVVVLYGTAGTAGRSVWRSAHRPAVRVLEGSATSGYDAERGDLCLDYEHTGLTRVLVTGGGRRPVLLLLADAHTAAGFWLPRTGAGPVLVRGPSLVRGARWAGRTIALRADTAEPEPVEVFASGAERLTVNGRAVPARVTSSGSLLANLPGPHPVTLPALRWRSRTEAPEAASGFNDSRWTVADRATSLSPTPALTRPVLFADDYGYHHGPVWYRGTFTATGAERTVKINAITGRRGNSLAWLNGRYLGAAPGGVEADGEPPVNPDPGPGEFAVPAGLLRPGQRSTVAVLAVNTGHNDDWTADDGRFRQPRGLVGAAVCDAAGVATPVVWRLQGAKGGEDPVDRIRGPLNGGGLYGERAGWPLPGSPAWSFRPADPATAWIGPGVSWLRSSFRLRLPGGQDVSVVLRFDGGRGDRRVILFLNGWNLGQHGPGVGPQCDFVLPAGLLRRAGRNLLTLAVIATEDSTVGGVRLVVAGNRRGGVPVRHVAAPGWFRCGPGADARRHLLNAHHHVGRSRAL